MKFLKLTQRGIAHYVVPFAVIVAVAIGGVAYIAINHADPSVPSGYQPIGGISTNETHVGFYACVYKASSTKWFIRGLAVMSPAVKDSSSYTFGLNAFEGMNGRGGGGVVTQTHSWSTYVKPLSARVLYTANILKGYSYSTSSYSTVPKTHPVTGANGGPEVNLKDLSVCKF